MITKPCGPVFNVHSIMSDFPPTSVGSQTDDLRHADGADYTDLHTQTCFELTGKNIDALIFTYERLEFTFYHPQ